MNHQNAAGKPVGTDWPFVTVSHVSETVCNRRGFSCYVSIFGCSLKRWPAASPLQSLIVFNTQNWRSSQIQTMMYFSCRIQLAILQNDLAQDIACKLVCWISETETLRTQDPDPGGLGRKGQSKEHPVLVQNHREIIRMPLMHGAWTRPCRVHGTAPHRRFPTSSHLGNS